MPNKDGTGPKGKGPLSGRGFGQCIIPLNTEEEERNFLDNQKQGLKDQLQKIESRIRAVKKNESK
jgi:hypothetical protein